MALTKGDIVDSICNRLDLPKYKSSQVVDPLLEIIKNTRLVIPHTLGNSNC